MFSRVRTRQYGIAVVIAGFLTLGVGIGYFGLAQHPNFARAVPKAVPKALISGASRANPQEVWVHTLSNQLALSSKRLDELEKTFQDLLKLNAKRQEEAHSETTAGALKEELRRHETMTAPASTLAPPPQNLGAPPLSQIANATNLKKISLPLQGQRKLLLKTTDNTVPAGAFAQAVLLGGVDASTSVQAASDPRPILLRLTHPGTLPRQFKSDLAGCHVLAASYGDLSSERVFMRLEKMTCVERKTGEVLEMSIQGYVAGEDGRAGIRGIVVDKAGAHMRNAMVGGFFSSIGKFLGQNRSPLLFSPKTGMVQQNAPDAADIFKQSAGQGLGGALDKYSDFFIKRAEQMQPVIQVAAGRKVDIVFSQGFDFSDSQLRKALSQHRDKSRLQQIQNLGGSQALSPSLSNQEGEHE
ncbi:MAG: TraB/VirB10 family protein [Gammaproteobacteria bacterium]|nr:TraB/VirB10 family protein [Gammaproteobacteria bacterium]MBP9728830.1 TraB/VirB10 family protein [Gammaproteobacteria bacterium]